MVGCSWKCEEAGCQLTGREARLTGSEEYSTLGTERITCSTICCFLQARLLASFTMVLLLLSIMGDLGLLLALVGFVMRMAVPDRWPFDPGESLLVSCEEVICLAQESWTVSGCAYWWVAIAAQAAG